MAEADFQTELLPLLAPTIANIVQACLPRLPAPLEEVRLRAGRPLHMVLSGLDRFVATDGRLVPNPEHAYTVTPEDVTRTFSLMAQGSVYAWEDEVRSGFLTLPGGHRVGLAGRAVTEGGAVKTLKQVASLNIRIAREVPGAAAGLLPRICVGGRVLSTILISPPQAGKTTLLRDLVRQISTGIPALRLPGQKVGLVDERSEVAASYHGIPQRAVGPRTDVLDNCPKAEGLMLLVRSMSPHVVAVDEIGRPEDAGAVMEALHAGVTVLATAHGYDLTDLSKRPALKELLAAGAFARAAIIGRSKGPGTLEQVIDLTATAGRNNGADLTTADGGVAV